MSHHIIRDLLIDPAPEPRPLELLRPSFYRLLGLYYTAIFLYGLSAGLLGLRTLTATTSHSFSIFWSIGLGTAGLIAGLGVWLSRRYKAEWIEVISTCIIIGLLVSYSFAIIAHSLIDPLAATALASFWLPVIIVMLPTWRISMIAMQGSLFINRRKRNRIKRNRIKRNRTK